MQFKMKNLLEMILYRMTKNKIFLCLALFIPPIVVIAAIIFTNNIEYTLRVRRDRTGDTKY